MKAHYFYFLVFVLTLASCSGNDNQSEVTPVINTPPETPRYLKKITYAVYYGQVNPIITDTVTFTYGGTKVTEMQNTLNGPRSMRFFYDGDKITQSQHLIDGTPFSMTGFSYANDLLVQTLPDNTDEEKTTYDYVNGIIATSNDYLYQGGGYVNTETRLFTHLGNNFPQVKIDQHYFLSSSATYTYTFDAKSNPAKYMNPYLRLYLEDKVGVFFNDLGQNNAIHATSVSSGTNETEYTVTYDGNFPVEKKTYSGSTLVSITKYEYL